MQTSGNCDEKYLLLHQKWVNHFRSRRPKSWQLLQPRGWRHNGNKTCYFEGALPILAMKGWNTGCPSTKGENHGGATRARTSASGILYTRNPNKIVRRVQRVVWALPHGRHLPRKKNLREEQCVPCTRDICACASWEGEEQQGSHR